MALSLVVLRETVTMALFMLVGFLLFKTEKITREGSRSLGNILVWVIIPGIIVSSFRAEPTPEKISELGVSLILSIAAMAVAVIVSRLVFPKRPVDSFGACFANCGFVGVPLVRAVLGDGAVFFTVAFIVLHNNLQYTYGRSLMDTGKRKLSLRELLLTPVAVGTLIGLILFFTGLGVRLPKVIANVLDGVSAMNSPLAMLILGVYLAQTDVKAVARAPHIYALTAVRLLLIPAVTMLALLPIPAPSEIKYAVLIVASASVGGNTAVFAELSGNDYPYASAAVALTTLASVITMPVVVGIAGAVGL